MTYKELERIKDSWNGKVCIWGAGLIGKTWGYDVIRAVGFSVDFYCDNNLPLGTVVRDGLKIRSTQQISNNYLVFVTVSEKHQQKIAEQLEEIGIKHFIKAGDSFLQEFYASVDQSDDRDIQEKYYEIYDDAAFLTKIFKEFLGYEMNLEHPVTFSEKMQWLKLYDRKPVYVGLSDKYQVKKYIAEILGSQYVVPLLGVWDRVEDIEFDKLPNQFVLKCNHNSGRGMCICKDKSKLDIEQVKKELRMGMEQDYYVFYREWQYKNIKRKIIAEKYLQDSEGSLKDYKILCYNGQPELLEYHQGRFERNYTQTFYDLKNWGKLDIEQVGAPKSDQDLEKPFFLEEMVNLSKRLAEGMKFVRIDWYYAEGQIYFGEFTFCDGSGLEPFASYGQDVFMGSFLKLNDQKRARV